MQTIYAVALTIMNFFIIFLALIIPFLALVGVLIILYYGLNKIKMLLFPSQKVEISEKVLEPKEIITSKVFWGYFIIGFVAFISVLIGLAVLVMYSLTNIH